MALDLTQFSLKNDAQNSADTPTGLDLSRYDINAKAALKEKTALAPGQTGDTFKDASLADKTGQVLAGIPKAAWQTIAGNAVKFGISAALAPVDIVRGLMGKAPINGETGGFAGLPSTKTFQADAADSLSKSMDTGESPLLGTAKAVLPTLGGAADTLGVEGATQAVDSLAKGGKSVYNAAKGIYEYIAPTAEKAVAKVAGALDSKLTKDLTKTAIEAVNPELTSAKKTTTAYKQAVTGSRDIKTASIFKEQGLTPDQQAVNLGTRLAGDLTLKDGSAVRGIAFTKDPVQNVKALNEALDSTEKQISAALKGDPELKYTADKPKLFESLNTAKSTIPREFAAIRDSKSIFNDVIDFAKKTFDKTPDTLEGIRDARTAFDAQAKIEYPNAFKNGLIDTKTPAGRAIKTARDLINEHLYNSAPNGSDIQQLIGREADIFRASENVAQKAAATHGMTATEQFAAKAPGKTALIKATGLGAAGAVGAGGVYEAGKKLIP